MTGTACPPSASAAKKNLETLMALEETLPTDRSERILWSELIRDCLEMNRKMQALIEEKVKELQTRYSHEKKILQTYHLHSEGECLPILLVLEWPFGAEIRGNPRSMRRLFKNEQTRFFRAPLSMTIYQIQNVLRTCFHFFESNAIESTPGRSERSTSHDRVTISSEARKKTEETAHPDRR